MHCSGDKCFILFDVRDFYFFFKGKSNDILVCQETVWKILKASAGFKPLLTFHSTVHKLIVFL